MLFLLDCYFFTSILARIIFSIQLKELELEEFLASDRGETDEDESDDAMADGSTRKHKK